MARLRCNSKTVICFWLTFRLRERHWFQARKGRLEPCPLSGLAAKFLTAGIETGSWRIDRFVVIPEGFSAFRRSVDASNDLQLSYRTDRPEKPLDRMFRRKFPALARHVGLLIGIETTENLQIIASVPEPERTGVQRMAAIMSEGVPGPVMPVVRPTSTRLARIVAPRAW